MLTFKELLNAKREYKTLEEISTEIYKGSSFSKDQIGTGTYPCIHYGELYTKYEIWFDKCVSTINPSLIRNKKYCEKGNLLITAIGEFVKSISKTCTYLGEEKAISGNSLFIIKHNQNPKYLSYALDTNSAKIQKQKLSLPGTIISISTENLKRIKIPIPLLEIQEKISEFLDLLREYVKRVRREK